MTAHRIVLVTVPDAKTADQIAAGLVSAKLAACVNILPGVVSQYRWKGKVVKDKELLLLCKTTKARLPAFKRWVEKNHPYTVPEVLALAIDSGSKDYLKWLGDSCR